MGCTCNPLCNITKLTIRTLLSKPDVGRKHLKDRGKDERSILVWILTDNEEGRRMETVRDCVQRIVFGGVGEACSRAVF